MTNNCFLNISYSNIKLKLVLVLFSICLLVFMGCGSFIKNAPGSNITKEEALNYSKRFMEDHSPIPLSQFSEPIVIEYPATANSFNSWDVDYNAQGYFADLSIDGGDTQGTVQKKPTQKEAYQIAKESLKHFCKRGKIDTEKFDKEKIISLENIETNVFTDNGIKNLTWGIQFDSPQYTVYMIINRVGELNEQFYWPKDSKQPSVITPPQAAIKQLSRQLGIAESSLPPPQIKAVSIANEGFSGLHQYHYTNVYRYDTDRIIAFVYVVQGDNSSIQDTDFQINYWPK